MICESWLLAAVIYFLAKVLLIAERMRMDCSNVVHMGNRRCLRRVRNMRAVISRGVALGLSSLSLLAGWSLVVGCSEVEEPPPRPTIRLTLDAPPEVGDDAKAKVATALQFIDEAGDRGVAFQHQPHRSAEKYMPEIMCAGVTAVDFNRDGAPDLLFINAGDYVNKGSRPADATNRLYFNDGAGRFTDVTEAWALPSAGYGHGAAVGDFDNDGWTDIYLTALDGGCMLLRNTGEGFEDITDVVGLPRDLGWPTSAGFFDMDHDGDLDLYVARYIEYDVETALRCYRGERHIYCTPVLYTGLQDRLYRNAGGQFVDVSTEAGLPEDGGNGLALAIGDIDHDGDQDLYVANDTTRNFLLLNDGTGKFTDRGANVGVAYSEEGFEEAGMGADMADFNKDDLLDIVCTNFQASTTSVYKQAANFFFNEVSDAVGVGETARARLSFGVDFFDADNDTDLDLIVANGHVQDIVSIYSGSVSFAQPNTLYENVGNEKLVDVTESAGSAFERIDVSRGLATADFDSDGALDFVIANNAGKAQLGMNRSAGVGQFINLWLEGRKANRSAIGAAVRVRVGDVTHDAQIMGSSSYLSHCDFRVHVGVGDAEMIDELTILWPGGETQILQGIPAGKYYRIVEGQQPEVYIPGERTILP